MRFPEPAGFMHLLLTTCTAHKRHDAGLLPATERYVDPRVDAAVALAARWKLPLVVFSGVYGLLDAAEPIPYYDHALQPDEVDGAATALAERLVAAGVARITAILEPRVVPGWAPYHDALEQGCQEAGVHLQVWTWDPIQRRVLDVVGVPGPAASSER